MHVAAAGTGAIDELDPKLEGCRRSRRRNSFSSTPIIALKLRIGGMVASPTPTVPISSDSISVTEMPDVTSCASADAAIHPAGAATDNHDRPDGISVHAAALFRIHQIFAVQRLGGNGSRDFLLHAIEQGGSLFDFDYIGKNVVTSRTDAMFAQKSDSIGLVEQVAVHHRDTAAAGI